MTKHSTEPESKPIESASDVSALIEDLQAFEKQLHTQEVADLDASLKTYKALSEKVAGAQKYLERIEVRLTEVTVHSGNGEAEGLD